MTPHKKLALCAALLLYAASAFAQEPLEPIVITASRMEQLQNSAAASTQIVTRDEMEAAGAENVGEALENHTGVIIDRDGHGDGVQLQGLGSEYVLILIDGEPMIGRIAGKIDLARIPIENIERIEIVKGASSALFGSDALAGVVNIITRKADKPFAAQFSQSLEPHQGLDSRGSLGWSGERFNALFSFARNSRSAIDLIPSNASTDLDGYANLTFSGKAAGQLNGKTRIELFAQSLAQEQDGLSENDSGLLERLGSIRSFNASAALERQLVQSAQLFAKLYATRYDDTSTTQIRGGDVVDRNLNIHDLLKGDLLLNALVHRRATLVAGAETVFERLESQRIDGGERDAGAQALFAQAEYRPLPRLALTAGARVDIHSVYGSHFSPKLSALFQASDRALLRASRGGGFRAPDFKDLYLDFTNASSGYQVFGNVDLMPESSRNWNLAVEYAVPRRGDLELRYYRNDLHNLIEAERIGKTAGGNSKYQYQNISEAFTEGVEADIETAEYAGFSFRVGYAYLRAENKLTEMPLLNRSAHTGNLSAAYRDGGRGLRVHLFGRYAGKWGLYDDGDRILEPEEYAPGYWIWNLRASKTFLETFKVSAGFNNLFDYKNPQYYAFYGRRFHLGLSYTH